jgi:plastocyanin
MRGYHLLAGVIAALAVTVPSRGQAPAFGSITGRVMLTARVRGAPLPSNVYSPRAVGRHEPTPIPEIKNVVVYLKDVAYRAAPPVMHAEIHQQNETFVPHILAVTRGSTVAFPNGDPFFHNVFSLSSAGTFNLGRYPEGESKSRTFMKAGTVKVYCQIHSHMSATILVLDHPYFTAPALDGGYTLADVPAGRYTVVGWHERIGEHAATVQVEAGKTATVDFSLPVEDEP